jgi:nitroreductase
MTQAAEQLEALLAARHSCRAFRPEPVPQPLIERMLAMAQRSASWCNSQPWQAIVTSGAATERVRQALFAHAEADQMAGERVALAQPDFPFPAHDAYQGVYRERRREVGWQLYRSVGIAHGDRAASLQQALLNFSLFGAPHMLMITSERDLGVYGALDCGLYLSNFMLAAQSLGVATVAQAALATYAPLMRELLDIPENRVVVVGASFGYADATHPANGFRAERAAVSEVAQFLND